MAGMGRDNRMRAAVGQIPAPEIPATGCKVAPPLAKARVAIVTTAGLRPAGDIKLWKGGDQSFTVLPGDARDFQLSHTSPNFDRVGVAADLNVVYPVDRLHDLVAEGHIGSVATNHAAFMGANFDVSTIQSDSGPAVAKMLLDDGVDIVLLTPV